MGTTQYTWRKDIFVLAIHMGYKILLYLMKYMQHKIQENNYNTTNLYRSYAMNTSKTEPNCLYLGQETHNNTENNRWVHFWLNILDKLNLI